VNRSPKTLFMYLGVLLGVLVVLAVPVRGNPFPPADFPDATRAILFTTAINLPVDLFLFSLLLYVVYLEFGIKAGKVTPSRARFIGRVLLGGVLVATLGAFIDFSFFYHKAGDSGYYFWIDFFAPLISSDSPALAMLFVLGSVYLVSILVVRLNRTLSLVPSCVVGFSNLFLWVVFGDTDRDTGSMYVLALLFVPFTVAVLFLLVRWHRKQFPQKTASHSGTAS